MNAKRKTETEDAAPEVKSYSIEEAIAEAGRRRDERFRTGREKPIEEAKAGADERAAEVVKDANTEQSKPVTKKAVGDRA